MAPVSSQPVVSGSVIVMASLPLGWTVMVQFWLLPWVFRTALVMSPSGDGEGVVSDAGVAGLDVLAEGQVEGEGAAVMGGRHIAEGSSEQHCRRVLLCPGR